MTAQTPPCWYRNNSTGQVFHVEGAMADRLATDPLYEPITDPTIPVVAPAETSNDGGGTEQHDGVDKPGPIPNRGRGRAKAANQ